MKLAMKLERYRERCGRLSNLESESEELCKYGINKERTLSCPSLRLSRS